MDYPKSDGTVGLVGGKFSDGNPGAGIAASRDPASWANQVTDELLAVIAAAGLVPDENVSTQLRDALTALGLQDATTALKGRVLLADAARAQGWVDNGSVLTPAMLAAAFQGVANQTLGDGQGYQRLPGGFLMQWGMGTTSSTVGAVSTITFPIAFAVSNPRVAVTAGAETGGTTSCWWSNIALTSFGVRSNLASIPVHWIAVGK